MNTRVLRGTVHGNAIEVAGDIGISEGEQVEVLVRWSGTEATQVGEGFRHTEGALADDIEWDAIMEELQRARKTDRRHQMEDA